jgi:elongation factor G
MGDLTNDLSGKRGHVTGTDSAGGELTTIKGMAPLSELSGYQMRLKSVTGGQGSYSIDFSHYAPVPPHTQAQLVSKHKQPVEEGEQ